MCFSSSHVPNSVWVSCGPTLCYAEPSCPFFLFPVLIQALLHIWTSPTPPQKTQENPFVMSPTVQFIMDGAQGHYKGSNCFKGSAFQCFLRNQFQNIINLQGEMFFVLFGEGGTLSLPLRKVIEDGWCLQNQGLKKKSGPFCLLHLENCLRTDNASTAGHNK